MGAWDWLGSMASAAVCRDTALLYGYTGDTEDTTSLDKTPAYGTGVTVNVIVNQPSSRWQTEFPDGNLNEAIEVWFKVPLPQTIRIRDKLVFNNKDYRVIDVANWGGHGAGIGALCQRIGGVT